MYQYPGSQDTVDLQAQTQRIVVEASEAGINLLQVLDKQHVRIISVEKKYEHKNVLNKSGMTYLCFIHVEIRHIYSEHFRLAKFVEESNFRDDDIRKTNNFYVNPRIKMENGNVIIWNPIHQTSISVKKSVVEFCVFSNPPVLIVTCADTTRIICFILEGIEKTLKIAGKLSVVKEYREMTQVFP
jgi:hypothetical protein